MEKIKETLYEYIFYEYVDFEDIKTDRSKRMYIKNMPKRKYNIKVLEYIIEKEDIKILEEIYKKGILEKDEIDICEIIEMGKLEIIKWIYEMCKKDKMEFKYNQVIVMDTKNKEILEWFWNRKEELEFLIDGYTTMELSFGGNVYALEWIYKKCKKNNIEFEYDEEDIKWAVFNGHLNVIEWFWEKSKKEGLEFRYNRDFGLALMRSKQIADWLWTKHITENLELDYNDDVIEYIYEFINS